ncbi:helix-turn-helix transcriptional regulator [Pseudonocardia dioxanivorans]|uniref:helix-turn-helix transcriptional regulator n=1 Tax=Pseudonocardia dioxanivorans TaxID=240495 RepID=UPI000CD29887|nr:helix-turn-helix domain-containing protein [Pseudonocardia dioxanivorans]
MSERREQILEIVQQALEPVEVGEVARAAGIHPNTARFHLDALVADGVLDCAAGAPAGRGRPRHTYRARPGQARGTARRYQLLAEILLSHLELSGEDAADKATTAGRAWGAYLAPRPAPARAVRPDAALTQLLTMLGDLDFAPEPVHTRPDGVDTADWPDVVRLRHCPFLELAVPQRDLVCRVHLGLMQGALAELKAPVSVTSLVPFEEPGACLAHLAPPGR